LSRVCSTCKLIKRNVYKHYKGCVYFNYTYKLLFIALFDDFNLIISIFHWKNSENSSISQLWFLSVIYLRFIITLVKGMFDLQIDKKKKKNYKFYTKSWPFCRRWLGECQFCTNSFVFLPFNVIQKKHNAYLRTFVPALSATTFRLGRKNCVSVEPVLSM
jgi:hypothetical protein